MEKSAALPILLALTFTASFAAEPDAVGVAFFKSGVLPVLEKNCYECHSHAANKIKAGLALDSKSGWAAGGESGLGCWLRANR